jgi:hypothetical protein
MGWYKMVRHTQAAIYRMAAAYPDIQVTIKMKGALTDDDIAAIETLMGVDRLPENIRIVTGGDPLDLIFPAPCGLRFQQHIAAGSPRRRKTGDRAPVR